MIFHQSYTKSFFQDYARGKECQIRLPGCWWSEGSVVLCHISEKGIKAMGKKLVPDILGAHGCDHCHAIVDGRALRPAGMTYQTVKVIFLEAVIRTQYLLIKEGLLPDPQRQ